MIFNIVKKIIIYKEIVSNSIIFYKKKCSNNEVKRDITVIRNLDCFNDMIKKYSFPELLSNKKGYFEKGDEFFCIIELNEIIAYGWLAYNRKFYISEIKKEINIENQKGMLFDFYTSSKHRKKGCYSDLLNYITSDERFNEYYIYALYGNEKSNSVIIKNGFEEVNKYRITSRIKLR